MKKTSGTARRSRLRAFPNSNRLMKFHNPNARLFVPDRAPEPLARITHLGIGAHQAQRLAAAGLLDFLALDSDDLVQDVGHGLKLPTGA